MSDINFPPILGSFQWAIFRLTIEARTALHLPAFKGSTLRGAFGQVFRRAVCPIKGQQCSGCPLQDRCVYAYIFETIPPPNDPFLREKYKAPHPFIIRPPREAREDFASGEPLAFELVLIGQAIDYLPYFVYTFMEMGQTGLGKGRGKFFLPSIESIGLDGTGEIIYQGAPQQLRNRIILLNGGDLLNYARVPESFTLRFLSRVRIK
ncbi:MAG: hypothetical protein PHW74_11645, partial [Desulfobacca sp.]|nr:hypothetical protein [Desulfobacca sp.]